MINMSEAIQDFGENVPFAKRGRELYFDREKAPPPPESIVIRINPKM